MGDFFQDQIDSSKGEAPPPPAKIDAPDWSGFFNTKAGEATENLKGAAQEKLAADARIGQETVGRMSQDRGIALQHLNAQGIEKEKMKPWNEQQEYEKFHHDPIQAFGSLASVFGIIASSFTHAPAASALNAATAAMDSVRENDEKGYKRAYDAWKANMDLVQKRFEMEHTMYSEALQLMNSDMTLGRVKLETAATRFGDKQLLAMLDAGLYEPIIKSVESRAKLAQELKTLDTSMTEEKIRKSFFDQEVARLGPNPPAEKVMSIFNTAYGTKEPWQQQYMHKVMLESKGNNEKVLEEATKLRDAQSNFNTMSAENKRSVEERTKYWAGNGVEPSEARLRAIAEVTAATTKSGAHDSMAGFRERIVKKAVQEYKDSHDGKEPDSKEMSKIQGMAYKKALTEQQELKLEEKQKNVDSIINQIDRVQQLINESRKRGDWLAPTGATGVGSRFLEWLSGGSEGAAEVQELIRTIQKEVKPIISGTTRINKEERADMDVIVPGLGIQKNPMQVMKGLETLKKILKKEDLLVPSELELRANENLSPPPAAGQTWLDENGNPLKIGDKKGGMVYKGGDPRSESSWAPDGG